MSIYSLSLAFFASALLFVAPSFADSIPGNTTNQSFNKAKKTLLHEVYSDHRLTFYCGSEFDGQSKVVAHTGGYQPRKKGERAYRMEWEHIVPAHAFGQSFAEWRDGHPECVDKKGKFFKGRNCAGKLSLPYRYMEADMHNLVPAIGELNGLRSNYSFARLGWELRPQSCNPESFRQQAGIEWLEFVVALNFFTCLQRIPWFLRTRLIRWTPT